MIELVLQGMGVGVGLAAPIGPINIEIIRRGLHGGFVSGWLVGAGALSADTLYCALIVSGLTPLADSAALRAPLFLAGALVLAYLGLVSVRGAVADTAVAAAQPSHRRSYVTGFLMATASPVGIVYWLSIGGALVASAVERAGAEGAPLLVGGVCLGILCWVTVLSLLTHGGRRYVSGSVLRWLTGLGGLMLVAFALTFAVQGARALADL